MFKDIILPILGTASLVLAIWVFMYFIGTGIAPNIRTHETEHAHCYTAGKMFFVSIACVPKVELSPFGSGR